MTGFVRRHAGKRLVAPIDDMHSLTFTERLNGRGTWQLDVGYGTATADVFLATTGSGIVAYWDGATMLSGYATAIRRKNNDVVTVVGIDDTALLGDRIVEPSPSNLSTTFQAFDVRTGPVSTVLTGFINANLGPTAHPDRRLSGFVMDTDPAIGPTKTVKGRWQRLDELVHTVATGHDIAYRALQNDSNQIVGQFRQMTRVTGEVFSTVGYDVIDFEAQESAATATRMITGGDGEGKARLIVRSAMPMKGRFAGRRIEEFSDERSEDDIAVLTERSEERLTDAKEMVALKVTIDGADAFDYVVGDLAAIEIDGTRENLPVYESKTTIKPDSVTRELTIGDHDRNDNTTGLARLATRSLNRIRNIERI